MNVWIFDRKKDFLDLVTTLGYLLVPLSSLPENPVLMRSFPVVLCGAGHLLSAQHQIIQCLQHLFEKSSTPTLFDVQIYFEQKIADKKVPYRWSNIFTQILDRVSSLTFVCGDAYRYQISVPIEMLLNQNIVFYDDLKDNFVSSFRLWCLVDRLIEYRLENLHLKTKPVHNLIVIDECTHYIGIRAERDEYHTSHFSDQYHQVARELGAAFVYSSSQPIRESLNENCSTQIYFPGNDGNINERCARTLNLNQKQKDYYFGIDEPGHALLKKGRF